MTVCLECLINFTAESVKCGFFVLKTKVDEITQQLLVH